MADSDYNIINPVEGLHNIAGLAPAKRREERRRRQKLFAEHRKEDKQKTNAKVTQQNKSSKISDDENCGHSIDYCA